MKRAHLILLAAAAGLGASAGSRPGTLPEGYLQPGGFDVLKVLPPAPAPADARGAADRAIFRATRSLRGTARWRMAIRDVGLTPTELFDDFSCAVGISLTPANAPRTAALIRRASFDTARQTGAAKMRYKRQRPFLIDAGPICQPVAEVADSYDYPSGHTTAGWTMATLLAQIAPDRASAVLARGRAFGESRIVCGVHNASAVDAGRLSASSTIAAMQGEPTFIADMSAAREEIADLRRSGTTGSPDTASCGREAALVAERIY